jgi:hypothetical protein
MAPQQLRVYWEKSQWGACIRRGWHHRCHKAPAAPF